MAKAKKSNEKNISWWIGVLASIALLLLFLNLQADNSNLLALDVKWLVIALIPLLIALLRSDVIQKFKGFGIELETRLQQPISNISLTARDAAESLPSDAKGRLEHLRNLPQAQRVKIQRLVFRTNRADYYRVEAVKNYLTDLYNVRYLEVVDPSERFVALLPAKIFRKGKSIDIQAVEDFLHAITTNDFLTHFKGLAVTETISENEDLLDALQKLRKSSYDFLPVIGEGGRLLGVVTLNAVERKIADEVLSVRGTN